MEPLQHATGPGPNLTLVPAPPQAVYKVFKRYPETWLIPLAALAIMLALGVWGTVQGSESQISHEKEIAIAGELMGEGPG